MGEYINKPVINVIGWVTVAILIGLSFMLLVAPIFE